MGTITAKSTTTWLHKWDNETAFEGKNEEGNPILNYERETYMLVECDNYGFTKGYKKFEMELRYYLATDKTFIDTDTGKEFTKTQKQFLPKISDLNYSKDIQTISYYRSLFGVSIPKEMNFYEGLLQNTASILISIVNKESEYGLAYQLIEE